MKFFGYLAATLIVFIGGALFNGYVLTYLWAWFIVTTFHLPPLGIAQAIGLGLVVGFLTQPRLKPQGEETYAEVLVWGVATNFLLPLLSLSIGWVVKAYL